MTTTRKLAGQYDLRKALVRGAADGSTPTVYEAWAYGELLHAKVWKRRGQDRDDIRSLWNHEVRTQLRLAAYPAAREFFVTLRAHGADPARYYVVLATEHRRLLAQALARRAEVPWLTDLRQSSKRLKLWEGLSRLAGALAILHDEGIVLRTLSPENVFTGLGGECDFRMSGFEWSLRLPSRPPGGGRMVGTRRPRAPELERVGGQYSVATDWFDFAVLASELFGVRVEGRKASLVRTDVEAHAMLSSAERRLLLALLAADPLDRLASGSSVRQEVGLVIAELRAYGGMATRPLHLAVRLGPTTRLTREIVALAPGLDPHDGGGQSEFIRKDLSGDVRVIARTAPDTHFVLRGRQLEYKVEQLTTGQDAPATWDVGYCDSTATPRFLPTDRVYGLGGRKLNIEQLRIVRQSLSTIRTRTIAWTQAFPPETGVVTLSLQERTVLDFFRITNQIDALLTAAQVWPVRVVSSGSTDTDTWIEVTPVPDDQRAALARHLCLDAPEAQMRDWFELGADVVEPDQADAVNYTFRSEGGLKRSTAQGDEVPWRFETASPHPDGSRYRFSHANPRMQPPKGTLYLGRDLGGTVAQLWRRHDAIEAMRNHAGLLSLIDDPVAARSETEDPLPFDPDAIGGLDESKVEALRLLWRTHPLFMVQGPPGTGKTRLVERFIEQQLLDDPAAQLLVTAHSHHTVDDLRRKVGQRFGSAEHTGSAPIITRLDREDDPQAPRRIAGRLARALQGSPAATRTAARLRDRLAAMIVDPPAEAAQIDLKSLEALVEQAANVTFATSNSGTLASLVGERQRYDWSILEEAGKAHGFDMATALQASHRLLMIGDHKQLPPFNAELMRKLLADPLRIRKAVEGGAGFASALVDRTIVSEPDGSEPLEERCKRWSQMVNLFGALFERAERDQHAGQAIALPLLKQHRMHPAIAQLVSATFYKGELDTPEETRRLFATTQPPFTIAPGSWLPATPLVFVDVPWVQKPKFAKGEQTGLFASEVEARAVGDVLQELRAISGRPCHVQVLSPYQDQITTIRGEINRRRGRGALAHLFGSEFDMARDLRVGATVDQFQGSEADVVVVSLVRNNPYKEWKSIGFLRDPTRVNVMLSRARHKLIVVGSWDFFWSRIDWKRPEESGEGLAHIRLLMENLVTAEQAGQLRRVRAPGAWNSA